MEGFDSEISRQDKIKHSKMGKKHLIKIVTLFIASQYKKHAAVWTTSIEQIQYQKRRRFLAIPRKIDTGLPVLVVALSVFPWASPDI